jgi:hypothetical protein
MTQRGVSIASRNNGSKLQTFVVCFSYLFKPTSDHLIMSAITFLFLFQSHRSVLNLEGTITVEALSYKPEGRGFIPDEAIELFQFTQSFQPHYALGVYSV